MTIQEIFHQLQTDIKNFSWQECVSTITQVASVWYAKKNKILLYPTGIIGVVLAAYVYFFISLPPLYADAWLNVYYFIMSVYGWYNWALKKEGQPEYPISWCNTKELNIGLTIFFAGWGILYFVLKFYTNSNVPVLDSFVSAASVTAMWWMAKRKIENWIAWLVSNAVAIPLNLYKHFVLFALMYILFLVLSWLGYKEWRKMATLKR